MSARAKRSQWKPSGRTNRAVLISLLIEAKRLVASFEKIEARHKLEIENHKKNDSDEIDEVERENLKQRTLIQNILGMGEPEKFNFDFHEFRRITTLDIESGNPVGESRVFMEVVAKTGICLLFRTILDSHSFLDIAYDPPLDIRSPPRFDVGLIYWLEMDLAILKLFVSAHDFYGEDDFLAIVEGKGEFNYHPQP